MNAELDKFNDWNYIKNTKWVSCCINLTLYALTHDAASASECNVKHKLNGLIHVICVYWPDATHEMKHYTTNRDQ